MRLSRSFTIESGLRRAIRDAECGETNELYLAFQPKIDLASEQMTGAEVLLRWTSPELGDVSPSEFIPIAEASDLIVRLGAWVLQSACNAASAWADDDDYPLNISVNVSATQLLDPGFVQYVAEVLTQSGLPSSQLELEVTEGVAIENIASSVSVLTSLKALGVRIALDDFGTGYASLSYLAALPIDTLKLDRAFVRDIGKTKKNAIVVAAILHLAGELALDVVVEGVETDAQLDFFAPYNGIQIQGFLFAKPMRMTAFANWKATRDARAIAALTSRESGMLPLPLPSCEAEHPQEYASLFAVRASA
jgi:EAL domain-containing protein (putative c-di-GMP-specific phosphodiesterase class I)